MTYLKPPKSMKACEAMLAEIQAELLVALTQAVRQRNFKETAYGVLICYVDLSTVEYVPYPTVLWEEHRASCIADRDVCDNIWFLPAIGSAWPCVMPESETLKRRCKLVYDFLTDNFKGAEELQILPFRNMIYRVSLILNRIDWSKILPITDDFTVMASDFTGSWVREDAEHSVPPTQQERLKKKGLFFNPDDLPEPEVPEGNPIPQMHQRSAAEQIPYWATQLDSLIQRTDCDATQAKWGSNRILRSLRELGEPGCEAILSVVENYAELPVPKDGAAREPHTVAILCEALSLADGAPSDSATEKRLWSLFDLTLKVGEACPAWTYVPAAVAHCIQSMFREKYDFWVKYDSVNQQLTNLDQINEQRQAKAPK